MNKTPVAYPAREMTTYVLKKDMKPGREGANYTLVYFTREGDVVDVFELKTKGGVERRGFQDNLTVDEASKIWKARLKQGYTLDQDYLAEV